LGSIVPNFDHATNPNGLIRLGSIVAFSWSPNYDAHHPPPPKLGSIVTDSRSAEGAGTGFVEPRWQSPLA